MLIQYCIAQEIWRERLADAERNRRVTAVAPESRSRRRARHAAGLLLLHLGLWLLAVASVVVESGLSRIRLPRFRPIAHTLDAQAPDERAGYPWRRV